MGEIPVVEPVENERRDNRAMVPDILYGLKQADCQWYHILWEALTEFDMKHIKSNPHTFITTTVIKKEKKMLILPIWVDDLFPVRDKELVNKLEMWIPTYFKTSPPCNTHYLLGICVT